MPFDLEKFFFDTPIYTRINLEDSDINKDEFSALFHTSSSSSFQHVEGYNPWRKAPSTFRITRTLSYSNNNILNFGGYGNVIVTCKRYNDEFNFYIYWNPQAQFIMKIGQYPTVADYHLGEVKQYKKVIPEEKLKELTRAIGLAANGVGIGSYVYLRRIFEHLIAEAFEKAKSENAISEADYQQARVDQRIDLLSPYLPTFLVENKSMYSIISLGIHELDEQTCLAHFDTLRVGIELILDEKLDEQRKKDKIEEAKKNLSILKGQIKK